jgi:hypothetical protein
MMRIGTDGGIPIALRKTNKNVFINQEQKLEVRRRLDIVLTTIIIIVTNLFLWHTKLKIINASTTTNDIGIII